MLPGVCATSSEDPPPPTTTVYSATDTVYVGAVKFSPGLFVTPGTFVLKPPAPPPPPRLTPAEPPPATTRYSILSPSDIPSDRAVTSKIPDDVKTCAL